jgi:hypothetical protein
MWQLFLHLSNGYLLSMAVWLSLLAASPVLLVKLRRRLKEKPKKLKWVFLGLSTWLCLCLLTAIELGFALLYDTTDSFSMTNASRRWFEVHVTPDLKVLEFSNGTGIEYRDTKEFPKPETLQQNSKHLCMLGDSFTFGHGVVRVEDRFSNRLETLLNETTAEDAATSRSVVSNLSKPGTDLYWVESVLKHAFADGHRIDNAVYVMCLNDVEAFHDPTMSESTNRAKFEPPTFLFRETYFFNWAWFRYQQVSQSGIRDYYDFVAGYYEGEPWQRFRPKLREVDQLCESNNCRLTVAVFPFLHSTGDDQFATIRQQITEACRQDGIEVIDLNRAFGGHRDEVLTVNAFDAHPNELAHQLVAEFLAPKLNFGQSRPTP